MPTAPNAGIYRAYGPLRLRRKSAIAPPLLPKKCLLNCSSTTSGSLGQTWRGLFRSSLGLMKRGKDHGERKRKSASASEAASRSAMNDRAKSAKKQQQADDAAAARSRMQAALSRGSMQSSHGAAASSDNVDGGQSAADDAAPGSDSALTGLQDPDAARASGASTAVHAAVARSSGQQARAVA